MARSRKNLRQREPRRAWPRLIQRGNGPSSLPRVVLVKHCIGIVGTFLVGASFLFACASSAPESDTGETDLSIHMAALSVNGDGAEEDASVEMTDGTPAEPLMSQGCGFSEIMANVIARFDVDQSGDLSAEEKASLVAAYGAPEDGVEARHPNRGQPTRAAVLLQAYDVDGSGSFEASEIALLQS